MSKVKGTLIRLLLTVAHTGIVFTISLLVTSTPRPPETSLFLKCNKRDSGSERRRIRFSIIIITSRWDYSYNVKATVLLHNDRMRAMRSGGCGGQVLKHSLAQVLTRNPRKQLK